MGGWWLASPKWTSTCQSSLSSCNTSAGFPRSCQRSGLRRTSAAAAPIARASILASCAMRAANEGIARPRKFIGTADAVVRYPNIELTFVHALSEQALRYTPARSIQPVRMKMQGNSRILPDPVRHLKYLPIRDVTHRLDFLQYLSSPGLSRRCISPHMIKCCLLGCGKGKMHRLSLIFTLVVPTIPPIASARQHLRLFWHTVPRPTPSPY